MSTCGKCGGNMFRVQQAEPTGSAFKVYFVQCSSCGVPIGVLEYSNSGAMIEGLEEKIDHIENEVQQIQNDTSTILNELKRR